MIPTAPRLVGYSAARRDSTVSLWNRVFRAMPNFRPFTVDSWRRRVEEFSVPGGESALAGSGPARFDPRLFRLALSGDGGDGDEVIGFAHGGTWEDEFLARLLPAGEPARLGTLLIIAVDPAHRRRGIARALLTDLEHTLADTHRVEPPLRPDGRGYNPFYGNFVAPVPPPWGTAEGIAVPFGAEGARGFCRAVGFREEVEAVTRHRSLTDRPAFRGKVPAGVVVEEIANYQPILGSDDGTPFPVRNESRTWILRGGDVQLGAIVAYPMSEDSGHWGIHSVEVDPSRRGEGLGRLLLSYVLAALAAHGARSVEALAIPAEGPEADHLYEGLGFEVVERWVVVA